MNITISKNTIFFAWLLIVTVVLALLVMGALDRNPNKLQPGDTINRYSPSTGSRYREVPDQSGDTYSPSSDPSNGDCITYDGDYTNDKC